MAERFDQYLAKVFPDFARLSLTSLTVLADLREKIERNRPIMCVQIVDDGAAETIALAAEVTVDSSQGKLLQSLESCRDCIHFRQRVVESNLKAYSKFHGLYEVACS